MIMNLELHLKIVGALLLVLAVMNVFLPRKLNWKEDAAKLTLLNRQIFQVHGFFIILILVLFGGLTLLYSHLLLKKGELNRLVLLGFTLFWAIRLFVQWFVYDRRLWLGNRFNTVVHFLCTGFWGYCAVTYGVALYRQF